MAHLTVIPDFARHPGRRTATIRDPAGRHSRERAARQRESSRTCLRSILGWIRLCASLVGTRNTIILAGLDPELEKRDAGAYSAAVHT